MLGEPEFRCAANDQCAPCRGLQSSYSLAHGGLRDFQSLCGLGEAARLGDHDEGFQQYRVEDVGLASWWFAERGCACAHSAQTIDIPGIASGEPQLAVACKSSRRVGEEVATNTQSWFSPSVGAVTRSVVDPGCVETAHLSCSSPVRGSNQAAVAGSCNVDRSTSSLPPFV